MTRSPGRGGAAGLVLLLSAFATTVTLAACGGAGESDRTTSAPVSSQVGDGGPAPRPGGVLERSGDVLRGRLEPGGGEEYRLPLVSGDAVHLEVVQSAVDVVLVVRPPGEAAPWTWDTPTLRQTAERLCFVATADGEHRLTVRPFAGDGGYEIRLRRRAPANPADLACARGTGHYLAGGSGSAEDRLAAYRRAARAWERAGQPFLAGLAWREAAVLQRDLGSLDRAIGLYRRGLERAVESADPYLHISVLNQLGTALAESGDRDGARRRLEEAAELARSGDRPYGLATSLSNLGTWELRAGDPHGALERYAEAGELWRSLDNPLELGEVLRGMGEAHGILDDHQYALDLLARAEILMRRAGAESRHAAVLFTEGWVHRLRGHPREALPPLRRALAVRRRLGDRVGETAVLDRIGSVLVELGRLDSAERTYLRSHRLAMETGRPHAAAATAGNLGCLHVQQGRLEDARTRLDEWRHGPGVADDPLSASHFDHCRARLAAAAGDPEAAVAHLRRARDTVDRLRLQALRRGHVYRPIWLWHDYAELEVELLLGLHRGTGEERYLAEAFRTSDLARARTLYEQVLVTRSARVEGARRAEDPLRAAERRLQEWTNRTAGRLDDASDAGAGRDRLERDLRRWWADLETVRAALRAGATEHPAEPPRPLRVDEVRRLLPPRTALLSYVLGESSSQLIRVDAGGVDALELPPRRDLEAASRAFHYAASRSVVDPVQAQLLAAELGAALLPPGSVPPDVDRLVVVADGMLHYVPFAALPSPRHPRRRLLDDYTLSITPSASLLARLAADPRPRREARGDGEARAAGETRADGSNGRIAVFADPVFATGDAGPGVGAVSTRAEALRGGPGEDPPRLPHTADEARAIARLAGTDRAWLNLRFDASRRRLLDTDLTPFRILHFATHAWVDEEHPELSGLLLSRLDRDGRTLPGELRLHEIQGLRLDADLTVLSGCETALGERVEGNGLEGLAHGFLHAGSRRVLVTLWPIDDLAAAALMGELYRRMLVVGEPPAEALRHAQLWLRRQPGWESEYYWAPFVLQGAL